MIEEDRFIANTPKENEEILEKSLRPADLDEYVGQEKIRDQLEIFIKAAQQRGKL